MMLGKSFQENRHGFCFMLKRCPSVYGGCCDFQLFDLMDHVSIWNCSGKRIWAQ